MEDEFFFALLRISIAQSLKACGFDKCKPSVLNTVTELYIKHLELIVERTKKFSIARTRVVNSVAGQDVIEALLDTGFMKATSPSDPEDTKNTKSLKSFRDWLVYSDNYAVSKRLSGVPTSLLANLIEKRKIDTSSETDQERKKRRLRERQEFFNQLKQGDENGKSDRAGDIPDDLDEDELTSNEKLPWLAYLAEKDMKLGQNMKFVNTCIQDDVMKVHKSSKFHPALADGEDSFASFKQQIHNYNRNDHLIIQLHEEDKSGEQQNQSVFPSSDLKSTLPYNVQYEESLINDDLQQYIQYASSHEDEIRERYLGLQSEEPEVIPIEDSENQPQEDADDDNSKKDPVAEEEYSTNVAENAELDEPSDPADGQDAKVKTPAVESTSNVGSPETVEVDNLPSKDASAEHNEETSDNEQSPSEHPLKRK